MNQPQEFLENVREQYEQLPYPPRNPEEEKQRLVPTHSGCLDLINHFCFGGKETFEKDFRILIAGGGTGDGAIFLAEQLRDYSAKLVYLDMSEASLNIAQERAKLRKLNNISFVHASIVDIPNLDLGQFNYIDCIGVLHHLEDPDAGLEILKKALKPEGAMGLMVYAKYGRTGVYQMQELMGLVNQKTKDIPAKIDNCKKMLAELPVSNGFKRFEEHVEDHDIFGDSGLYDLLLHEQDRSYTIPELYDFLDKQQLHLKHFIVHGGMGKLTYDPKLYIKDPDLLAVIRKKDKRKQQAIAEMISCSIKAHCFYVNQKETPSPSIDDLDMIPFFSMRFHSDEMYATLYEHSKKKTDTIKINHAVSKKSIAFKRTPHTTLFFKYLDGFRTTREIITAIQNDEEVQSSPPTEAGLLEEIKLIYNNFHLLEWMLLRDPHVPHFVTGKDMQYRVSKDYFTDAEMGAITNE